MKFFIFFGIYMEDHTTPAWTVLKDKDQTLPILQLPRSFRS